MKFQQFYAGLQKVIHNKLFETLVVLVIMTAAILVGVRTYIISDQVNYWINILDYAITIFFLFELTLRFMSYENKKEFFRHGWNWFDLIVVAASLIPAENSEYAYVARLVRIFRVLRMVSFIPELRALINAVLKAMPQLGYVSMMLFIIFYIFAAVGGAFFAQVNQTLWGDIGVSMLTLFRVMTFEDWTDVMYETMEVYPLSWIYYLAFIFLTTFAFLNMVIGVVVNALEEEHKKQSKEEQDSEFALLRSEIQELKSMLMEQQKKAS